MVCPAGQIATTVTGGASSSVDGCESCLPGTYSLGGKFTACQNSNCPAGKIAAKTGASSSTNGCEICDIG